jgi:UDP-N-acetylmuramoylalanine--D-glutamate ligase
VVLIAGGRDKGGDYGPLAESARGRVKTAVLLGESRELLEKAFRGVIPLQRAEDMEDAVTKAFAASQADEAVVLAPACSSFDMFEDYVHRGMVFQEIVKGLAHGR